MTFADHAALATERYVQSVPPGARKGRGQFFTSRETAAFMAGLLQIPPGTRTVAALDPGAGTGMLVCALLDRLEAAPDLEEVRLVCWENDAAVLEPLEANLRWAARNCAKTIRYQIVQGNYILDQAARFGRPGPGEGKADLVVCNPPYKKLRSDAPEARALELVCGGAPNLYFLFAAMAMDNLREGGQAVLIIPRSWTGGACFARFRKWLFGQGVLERAHLFSSRSGVFDDVLQEIMIIKMRKTRIPPGTVAVTTSQGGTDFRGGGRCDAPYGMVVRDGGAKVRLPASQEDLEALSLLDRLTLPEIGLRMRTGAVVDFRCAGAMRDRPGEGAVPLLRACHIREGRVAFPLGAKGEYIAPRPALAVPNANYLLARRFAAKEERRRLQPAVHLARLRPEWKRLCIENKVDFIQGRGPLSEDVVLGLHVLFNSTLYDRCYRIIGGSTQVNATQVNSMPVPPLETIEAMGRELARAGDLGTRTCDAILEGHLRGRGASDPALEGGGRV